MWEPRPFRLGQHMTISEYSEPTFGTDRLIVAFPLKTTITISNRTR
jgi:hypothetical protein